MGTTRDGAARTAARKQLSVLDAFDGEHRALTLSDVARRSGLPVSTAHRLVGDLLDRGGLERDADGRLRIERFTERTVVDPRVLRRLLAEVRRSQLAVSDGQVTLDALSVAAPVRGPGGEVAAALSVVVLADGAEPRALAPAVRTAAAAISRALAR